MNNWNGATPPVWSRRGKMRRKRCAWIRTRPKRILLRLKRAAAEISWTGETKRARDILALLPAGQDPDGQVTSAYCTLALYDRNFSEAFRLLRAYSGEKLPVVDSFGLGSRETKTFNGAIISLYAGDFARAYGLFDSERWSAELDNSKDPSSLGHAGLAVLYAQMRWTEQALAEARRAQELKPPADWYADIYFHFTLARAYAWAGNAD